MVFIVCHCQLRSLALFHHGPYSVRFVAVTILQWIDFHLFLFQHLAIIQNLKQCSNHM